MTDSQWRISTSCGDIATYTHDHTWYEGDQRGARTGDQVKKALSVGVIWAIGLCAEPALAADMGFPLYGPSPAPAFSWTGFYAGVNLGDGWSKHSTTLGFTPINSGEVNGVIGGGQLGANWQVGSFVLGAEADIEGSSQQKTSTSPFPGFPVVTLTEDYSKPWFATFRGRVGWAFADGWLVYATGGGAMLDAKSTFTAGAPGFLTLSSGFELSHLGWAAGGGLENAINRNWSWKVEYIGMQTGSFTSSVNFLGRTVLWHAKLGENVARVGLNY